MECPSGWAQGGYQVRVLAWLYLFHSMEIQLTACFLVSGHPTVFVGNIGDAIDEYTLFESFSQFNCSDSRIIRGEDGRCLGYGFVTIRTQEDAQAAVTAMDGQRLMGRPLRVSFAKSPRLTEPGAAAPPDPTTSRSRPPENTAPLDPKVVATQASDTNCTVHVGNLLGEDARRASGERHHAQAVNFLRSPPTVEVSKSSQ